MFRNNIRHSYTNMGIFNISQPWLNINISNLDPKKL